MNPLIRRAHEARINAEAQIRKILDQAEADKRDLTGEDEEQIERLDKTCRDLNARISELLDEEQRRGDIDAAIASIPVSSPEEREQVRDIDTELRELARGERREVVVSPERRDLTKGTPTAGGNTVPTSFYDRLWEHMIEVSGILRADPTILNTQSGENIEIPVTTAHSTAALTAEGAAIPESDPEFAKRTLGAYKYALLIQVSRELTEDTGVDLLGYLARQAGRACGNAIGAHLITGSGSGQPTGVVTSATVGVTGGAGVGGAFTADNLIDLHYSVIEAYRNSASCGWLMRDATLGAVRKLKDDNGQFLWQPSLQIGAPDTLLGKPVRTDPNVAAVAATAKSVVFGDFAAYFVRLAGGIRFERSDEFAFANDLVSFRCILRGDGVLADQTGAVKVFQGGAA